MPSSLAHPPAPISRRLLVLGEGGEARLGVVAILLHPLEAVLGLLGQRLGGVDARPAGHGQEDELLADLREVDLLLAPARGAGDEAVGAGPGLDALLPGGLELGLVDVGRHEDGREVGDGRLGDGHEAVVEDDDVVVGLVLARGVGDGLEELLDLLGLGVAGGGLDGVEARPDCVV